MRLRIRSVPVRALGALLLVGALFTAYTVPASAAPSPLAVVENGSVDLAPAAAVDGPGHHFGFGQASVLAQTTPDLTGTAIAAQQTQQAAPPPGTTGSGPCTTVVGQSCTISGAVSGSWTKTSSGSYTVTATVPATAILNDGAPRIFLPTTAGVEQGTCTIPTAIGGTVTCSGTTTGDLLQGAVVTVRFVTTGGFQDVTGTVTGTGGVGALTITKTGSPTLVTVRDQFTTTPLTYTITVSHPATAAAAQNVVVTDTLPANVTFLSATSTVGTCTGSTGVTTVTCTVGTLATGQTATITIQVLVPLAVCGGVGGGLGVGVNPLGPIGGPGFGNPVGPIGGFGASNFGVGGNTTQTLTNTASVTATGVTAPAPATTTTTVTCGIGQAFPLLPPPPLLLPPPPPPLLPPPPGMGMGAMAAPRAAFPEVPVIPEADSVVLLGIGLAAMAVVAGLRSRRRND
jgi:uncharacterized repeat protein (TIGR01451 family)